MPKGTDPQDPTLAQEAFKIVSDPYFKHISIEKYRFGQFVETIYDSRLLNFRHLNPAEQTAWQREILQETEEKVVCLIRNPEDRVIFKEIHSYEQNLCRECRIYSPHDLLLSIQKIFYTQLRDPFNGVILYDNHDHTVMIKRYAIDEGGEFTHLLEEQWSPQKFQGKGSD